MPVVCGEVSNRERDGQVRNGDIASMTPAQHSAARGEESSDISYYCIRCGGRLLSPTSSSSSHPGQPLTNHLQVRKFRADETLRLKSSFKAQRSQAAFTHQRITSGLPLLPKCSRAPGRKGPAVRQTPDHIDEIGGMKAYTRARPWVFKLAVQVCVWAVLEARNQVESTSRGRKGEKEE